MVVKNKTARLPKRDKIMVHSPSPTDLLQLGSVRRSNKTARLPQSVVPVIHWQSGGFVIHYTAVCKPFVKHLRAAFCFNRSLEFESEPPCPLLTAAHMPRASCANHHTPTTRSAAHKITRYKLIPSQDMGDDWTTCDVEAGEASHGNAEFGTASFLFDNVYSCTLGFFFDTSHSALIQGLNNIGSLWARDSQN